MALWSGGSVAAMRFARMRSTSDRCASAAITSASASRTKTVLVIQKDS